MSKQGTETPEENALRERRRLQWKWVEAKVWTDNMLAALANGVKGNKWYSLIDKVYATDTLWEAWQDVRSNRGAAGVDHVSVRAFEAMEWIYLEELHEELKTGKYLPGAVKRVHIPKGPGKTRPLGIPNVKDRVIQAAIVKVIEPIFEREFLPSSYGFRPGRGAKDALREVDWAIKDGNVWVVDADLQSYFDTIPHDKLMELVSERISDQRLLNLIKAFLNQKIMEGLKIWAPTQGTPQGAVLSPLLANLYLHDLDKQMAEEGYKMVRYADDFVILTASEESARIALDRVKEWVQSRGLTLHPEKTHIGNCTVEGQGFEFLGYRFEEGKRHVRKKSLAKLRDKIREKTRRNCGRNMKVVIADLNRTLKGWFNYFKHAYKPVFQATDGFIRRRLRAILRRREKRPGFGKTYEDHRRWPNVYFAKLGLFTMKEAIELEVASRSR